MMHSCPCMRCAVSQLCGVLQEIAAKYGTLSEDDGVAFRGTFLINPEGVLEHITINNMGIGRNIDEAKRVLQAVQFVAEHGEVRPHLHASCSAASALLLRTSHLMAIFTQRRHIHCVPCGVTALSQQAIFTNNRRSTEPPRQPLHFSKI